MRLDLKAIIQKYNPVCRDFFFSFHFLNHRPLKVNTFCNNTHTIHKVKDLRMKNRKQGVSLWQKVKKNNFLFKMCIVFLFDMDKKCSKIFCSPEGCLPDFNFLLLR